MVPAPMAMVVFALFADVSSAEAAAKDLQHQRTGHTPRTIQVHDRAPLDGNVLPDGATEYGRNLVIATVGGGLFMAAAGGTAGALDLVLGMNVGLGIGLGLVTGLLMGLVGAMQAGTRIAKAQLRELEPRLEDGHRLVLVEVAAREVDAVVHTLERHDSVLVDAVGGL